MKIIEQTFERLVIRFGDAILPAVIFVIALVIGLAFAVFGSADDNVLLILLGVLIAFGGLLRLLMERYTTLTFDRIAGMLHIQQRRALVPSGGSYSLRDVRRVDAICDSGTPINEVPPDSKARCDLVIDFDDMPDFVVARRVKRDEAAEFVRAVRGFLEWD